MAQAGVGTLLSLLLAPCTYQEQSMKSILSSVSTFRLKLLDAPGTVLSALQIITCLSSLRILGRRWCSITLFLPIRKQRQEGVWVTHLKSHASPGWDRGVNPLFLAVVWPSVWVFPQKEDFHDSLLRRAHRFTIISMSTFLHYSWLVDWWMDCLHHSNESFTGKWLMFLLLTAGYPAFSRLSGSQEVPNKYLLKHMHAFIN